MKLFDDFYFGLRRLSNSLYFTSISVFVIVLALALYLCSYSLTYNLTKPLPIENGDRFVAVKTFYNESSVSHFGSNFDGFAYNQLKSQLTSFSEFGVYRFSKLSLSDGVRPEQYAGAEIEPRLLQIVGIAPLMGRLFEEDDALPDSQPVAILSYSTWSNYYAGDPEILGKTTRINSEPYIVVGVMPENFDYPFSQQVWLTLRTDQYTQPDGNMSLGALGVLANDSTLESASAEVSELMTRLAVEYPAFYSETIAQVVGHTEAGLTQTNTGRLFELVTITILLLATLNLGTLLFVRTNDRQKELAIRYAVGANRWEILQQVLLESLILCALGFVLSLGIADVVLAAVEEKLRVNAASGDYPGSLASWINLTIDARAFSIAFALTLMVWLISGSFAAYQAIRKDNNVVLAGGSKGGTDRSRALVSRFIVGFEVTASCFLLIVCCLLVAAIVTTYRMDFGTPTENYYTGMFELKGSSYEDASARNEFIETLQRSLADRPDTIDAIVATALPGQYGRLVRYGVEDRDLRVDEQYPEQTSVLIQSNYFSMLDVPLIEGRFFDSGDTIDSLPVAIVNEAFAASLWPGESALGKRVLINPNSDNSWHTVIGVSSHIIHGNPLGNYDNNPTIYRSLKQESSTFYSFAFKSNQDINFNEAERIMTETTSEIDRDLPITSIRSLSTVTEMSMQGMDLVAQFSIAFALGTFALAIVGVYGNISRAVSQRTNEIGIRRALGSSDKSVLWVFLRESAVYLIWGAAVGGSLAVLASGALAGYFNNILAFLPVIVPSVIVLIGFLIIAASYLPARKAIAIEPGEALRYE